MPASSITRRYPRLQCENEKAAQCAAFSWCEPERSGYGIGPTYSPPTGAATAAVGLAAPAGFFDSAASLSSASRSCAGGT